MSGMRVLALGVIAGGALMGLATLQPAAAVGCVSGAVAGGVVGHVAGHHGLAGAAVGCAVGHHEAKKQAAQRQVNNSGNTPAQK